MLIVAHVFVDDVSKVALTKKEEMVTEHHVPNRAEYTKRLHRKEVASVQRDPMRMNTRCPGSRCRASMCRGAVVVHIR